MAITKRLTISSQNRAVTGKRTGSYTIFTTSGLALGIPNGAIITKIETPKNMFWVTGNPGEYSADFRVTDKESNISNILNKPYSIAVHYSNGTNTNTAPQATIDFLNKSSNEFQTKKFYFYGQGYYSQSNTNGNITIQFGDRSPSALGIYIDITYVEPAPVIRAKLIDRTGFYSVDNPVWDKNNSRADIYIEAETYGGTTITSYHYEYWYGTRTDSNVNSGEITNPTSTLVLSNLPVSNSEGDLSYKIYAKDNLGQQSNTVEGTIVGIDYTIPNKIVKFEIQRSSNNEDENNPDPDDAGEYLYAIIRLQGDDLALFYTEEKIRIFFTISNSSQDFLLAFAKDDENRSDQYYRSFPTPNNKDDIIGKDYTFLLTKNGDNESIFKGSNTTDVSISMAISFGLQTGTEVEWVPISNLTATRIVNATPSIFSIEREGVAFGCELKKPATSGNEEDVYSLNDPKFLCNMRAYFKKKVSFDKRLTLKDGIEGDVIFLNTDSYIEEIENEQTVRKYGWEPITLNSAFTVWNETTDSCQSKRKLDSVSIIGAIKPSANIAAGSTTLIATLDKRYAPPHRLQFRACLESTTIEGRIIVAPQYESDGTTVSGTTLSFVNRGAAANTNLWISICINYMV